MDQLLKKYGASRSTMALAMSRQGILPDQLKPMSPSTFHNNVDPKIKMHEEARIKVHNAQRDVLLAELEMELKLLQPAIKKHGESHIELVLIPYKSVTGAKLVTSMTELPHLKTKINAEAVNVPESVEVPKWLDQDGDGIISKEEYQVLERENARAAKLAKQNQKNIDAILKRVALRGKQELDASKASEDLKRRKQRVAAAHNADRVRIIELAQNRLKKQMENQKLQEEQQQLFQKTHTLEMQQFKKKEQQRQQNLAQKNYEKQQRKKTTKMANEAKVKQETEKKTKRMEKMLLKRKEKDKQRNMQKLLEAQELAVLANERQKIRDERLLWAKQMHLDKALKLKQEEERKEKIIREAKETIAKDEKRKLYEKSREMKVKDQFAGTKYLNRSDSSFHSSLLSLLSFALLFLCYSLSVSLLSPLSVVTL